MTEYEAWCDKAYFDMWAVKEKGSMCFNEVIHVKTKEEADFIVAKFNGVKALVDALEFYAELDVHNMARFYLDSGNKAKQVLSQHKENQ